MTDFIFLHSKITADSDCSHEIKRWSLLGRRVMTNIDRVLKSRDITLPTKICIVKAMFSLVVLCGCESWATKKRDHQRTNAFKSWCWRRLWENSQDCKEIKSVSPKRNQPWILIEGLMLKLKSKYYGHLIQRINSLDMTLMLGKIEGKRRRGW